MQFSCESCKTQLQIADEKVRGKRLIVRCKRCGAKIGISDPALGAPKAPLRPAGSAPPPAQASAPPAPSKPAPAAAAAPAARPAKRDSDTESTLAIDSDLLERALQASKNDDPSIAPNGVPPASEQRAAPAPAPAPAAPAPGEEAIWFAMLHGKQNGPFTVAELTAKTNEGAVGPRTYLWKDGMDAWQRAKDIGELQALFPQAPPPPPPPPPVPAVGQGLREFSTPDFVAPVASTPPPASEPPKAAEPAREEERTSVDPLPLGERVHQEGVAKELFTSTSSGENSAVKAAAADLAGWASTELEKKPAPPSAAPRAVMFASTAPPQSRMPTVMIAGVIVLAIVAGGLWYFYGSGTAAAPPKKEEAAAPAQTVPADKKPEPPPGEKEKPPEKQATEKPAEKPVEKKPEPVPTGLTADQVRKKLDENKGALQGCIDEALRRDPNLRVGKIHIATTIAPSGQVTTAKIDKATVDQSPLGACLRRATRRIAFPAFSGDAFDVDIPIVVTAGD